jgi:hypothetical protein
VRYADPVATDTCAIIIGIDGYAFAPLTSAVNDAVALRDELTAPGPGGTPPLVAAADVTLLASPGPGQPAPPGSRPATRRAILDALKAHYESPAARRRLIFYFAGHGMSASRDGRVREALLLAADVESPTDGEHMICLDDLLALFAERGPLEQLWLVDACRDMPYERRPRGYDVSWPEEPPQAPRAQFAMHAVGAGGKALSAQGGHGRFTHLLLRGLRGTGIANEPVPGRGRCVTADSLFNYVHRHVLASLRGWDEWTRTVQVPESRSRGPALAPLREVPPPPPREFVVKVEPEAAQPAVDLALEIELGLPVPGWPPKAPARQYELRAALKAGMTEQGWGTPKPQLMVVDLREEESATVEVPRSGGTVMTRGGGPRPSAAAAAPAVTTGERGIARAEIARSAAPARRPLRRSGGGTGVAPTTATLRVEASDIQAHVRLRLSRHPFTLIERAQPNMDLTVAPGAWDVQVMLGDEVISAARVLLAGGERGVVTAVAQITPALASLLPQRPAGAVDERPTSVMPSETIGPMQGAVLPTLLPLLALKPFDHDGVLLRQFSHLQIPQRGPWPPPSDGEPRCAIAVALDGELTPGRHTDVRAAARVWASPDRRLALYATDGKPPDEGVDIFVSGTRLNVAAPGVPGGVTAIGVISWPSGVTQVSVGIYRLPLGVAWDAPSAPGGPGFPPGRIARALAIAVPWFRAGADLDTLRGPELMEIAYGKWIDPVLGLIAHHALHESRRAARPGDPAPVEMLGTIQRNLSQAFGALPDCLVIAAVRQDADAQQAAMARLLDDRRLRQPVLVASLALLAEAARRAGRMDHWSIDRLDRIAPGEVFNVVVTTP